MKPFFNAFFTALLLACASMYSTAQRFVKTGGPITDYAGSYHVDSFPIVVSNLPQRIDTAFGLSKICFTIPHKRVSDLKIELLSPDGTVIWLTNRNGLEGAYYFNTCFSSNGFNGYVHQAAAPFNGEYIPDGRLDFINNGQNPNGTWYLLVQDLRPGIQGNVEEIALQFSENPMPGIRSGNCSLANPAACRCADGSQQPCTLLPDLIMLPAFTSQQIKEYPQDDPYYPGQLRFAASIANIGSGPLELFGKKEWFCGKERSDSFTRCPNGNLPHQKLSQRIYRLSGDTLAYDDMDAGFNYYDEHPGHNHYHVDNWVEFRLVKKEFRKNGSLKKQTIVAKGRKVSFCLFDYGICNNSDSLCAFNNRLYGEKTLPNYSFGGFRDCKSGKQGISVGAYDTYGLLYEGQYLQLPKGLASGTYYLQIEIDPEHFIHESDRSNNQLEIIVKISKQSLAKINKNK